MEDWPVLGVGSSELETVESDALIAIERPRHTLILIEHNRLHNVVFVCVIFIRPAQSRNDDVSIDVDQQIPVRGTLVLKLVERVYCESIHRYWGSLSVS